MIPVVDLHCDLLTSLSLDCPRTDTDLSLRCSYPQLEKGGVYLQTLAIFTETKPGSHHFALKQLQAFRSLVKEHWKRAKLPFSVGERGPISVLLAIENASGLLEENEPLDLLFDRLDTLFEEGLPILYISLTWNDENRFGGGNLAPGIGLKNDGVKLLEYLHEKALRGHKTAVDFSHTSDALAHDILDTIDRKKLKITTIASHSNFRAIEDQPRNLPDELASELFRRGGVIGLNFIRRFIGLPFENNFIRHIEQGIKLGGRDALLFGADFFCDEDFPALSQSAPFFNESYADGSTYPKMLQVIEKSFGSQMAKQMAYQNFERFISRCHIS